MRARGRFGESARAWPVVLALAVMAAGGAAHAQLEVNVNGGVILYDGASQRMSRGAHPSARIISGGHRHMHGAASHGATVPAPPPAVAAAIHDSAQRHRVDEGLVTAVAWQESRYRTDAVSPKGARGTMQLMPSTARVLGVDSDSTDGNIEGGVVYLSKMMQRYDGDTARALAAYNAGPGAVDRAGGVPPYRETQGYVHAIMGRIGHIGGPAEDDSPLRARMGAE